MSGRPEVERIEVSLDVSAVPAQPAGAGRYVVELARALAGRVDCGLNLVSRRGDAGRWHKIAPRQKVLPVAPDTRAARLAYERWRLGPVVGRLDSPPVSVHHGPHYTMPRFSRVPCVVTVHDMTFFDHPEWHEASKVVFFRKDIRHAARDAAAIVCVSRTAARRLEGLLSPQCPVTVIPHGVDHDRFGPREPVPGADSDALARLGVERPYLLHLGTIEPRKGVADLVGAFDLVAGGQAGLDLVLAGGTGWKAGPVLEAIAAARASSSIRRLGYVADGDVPALLRRARAVCYPSLEEGFGLPALEALACGAPLITTAGTAMAELADDAAVLVSPGSVEELAAAIEAVLESAGTSAAEQRRLHGIEVAGAYNWQASAESHLAVYRAASATGRPRRRRHTSAPRGSS